MIRFVMCYNTCLEVDSVFRRACVTVVREGCRSLA